MEHGAATPVDSVHRRHRHEGPDIGEDAPGRGAEEPEVRFGDDGGSRKGPTELRNHGLCNRAVPETMSTHLQSPSVGGGVGRGVPATSTGEGDVMAPHGANAIDSEAPKRFLETIVPSEAPKLGHGGLKAGGGC